MAALHGGGGFGVAKSPEGDRLTRLEGFDEDGVGVSSVNTMVSRKSPPGETNFQTVPQIQRR